MVAKSGISKEELIEWGGAEVFNQALAICNSGDVRRVEYDDDTLTVKGLIEQPDGWEMPVSFKLLAGGRIRSMCPCRTNVVEHRVCPHVVALGLAIMVQEMDVEDETPKHPAPPPPADEPAEEDLVEVPLRPRFYCKLAGSRASLSILVNARYGTVEFPAGSLQPPRAVWLKDEDDPLVRRVRSPSAEREPAKILTQWGFAPGYREGDVKYYLTDPQRVLTFLGAGVPDLRRRGWRVELTDALEKMTDAMPFVQPVVTIKDAPGGDFDVHYTFAAHAAGKEMRTVSPTLIQAAINRGDGYVMEGGAVVLLDRGGIESLRDVFNDCSSSQNGAERGWFRVRGSYAPYVRSSLDELDENITVNDAHAKFWRKVTARTKGGNETARFEPIPLGGLDNILRPYQKQGVYWMRFLEAAGHSGLLADEMGLGKTLQTLAWLSLPRSDARAHRPNGTNLPALIVCPTSLVRNWEAEARKFVPAMKTLVVSGPDRAADFKRIDAADLVITSYALLTRDFDAAYLGRAFSVVVLDEAQHIKNRETRNAKAVKGLEPVQRLVLTGTPVENSVADVWSIFDFLLPDYLGGYETFKMNFEDPIRDEENADAVLARLKRKISPFILRRLKKSVAKDLPEKIIKVSYCPMSDEAQREYNAALQSARQTAGALIEEKGFGRSKIELLALLMKLRQIASRAKVEAFMEQLQTAIAGGHKILVFSQFVKMLDILQKELRKAGIPYCYLDGSTKDRLGQCNTFNRTPEIPVFLISLMAGGTGLNLTGADMVMHYDPWWNPAVEDQATDRAHRIGQKKTVYVMKMIAAGSVEEKVLALQRKKQAIISATVNTTDTAIMEKLTAADLNELLS